MNVLDLFSGIGGFSLGLERAGMRTVAFCEIDPFCRKVLAKHWPGVPCYDDIRTLTADRLATDGISVDAICGGFPCQDISVAGKGAGLAGERSGLWSEYARVIGEIRPRFVIVENVAALLARGVDRVLGDLAALGFDAWWGCIRASDIGAEHERDRLWIVAYANPARLQGGMQAGTNRTHVAEIGARVRSSVMAAGPFPRQYWINKPVLGGRIYGLSKRLDGGLNAISQARSFEKLRTLRRADVEESIHLWTSGGYGALQKKEILQSGVPATGAGQAVCDPQADHDVARQEAQESLMRGMRHANEITYPSHGSGFDEQWPRQPDDAVRDLPQQTPRRAARIAALGNAVVPQIPEIIGRAIMSANA